MIRLNQTQHTNGPAGAFAAFEMHAGESEQSLKLLGFVEVSMKGSMGMNGVCLILDAQRALVDERPVIVGDGSVGTLRRLAIAAIRQGFATETDVA